MYHGGNSSAAWPRRRFARRRWSGPRALWGSAPNLAFRLVWPRPGRPLTKFSIGCSTKWSADSPKRCLARRIFQRRLKSPSRHWAPSSPTPRSQRCGSCGPDSGLAGRPRNRSRKCPPKCGPVFFRCLKRRMGWAPQRPGAFGAPFDNPARSWDINGKHGPSILPEGEKGTRQAFRRSVAAPATVSGVPTLFATGLFMGSGKAAPAIRCEPGDLPCADEFRRAAGGAARERS